MAGSVFQRMRADGFQGFRTVTITVRFENFVTLSRSLTAGSVMLALETLVERVEHLFAPFFDERENPRSRRIRLIGVRVEKLARAGDAPAVTSPDLAPRADGESFPPNEPDPSSQVPDQRLP
jgi:nucleotidyltransferase/DNA polymerase involved in DNA repair